VDAEFMGESIQRQQFSLADAIRHDLLRTVQDLWRHRSYAAIPHAQRVDGHAQQVSQLALQESDGSPQLA